MPCHSGPRSEALWARCSGAGPRRGGASGQPRTSGLGIECPPSSRRSSQASGQGGPRPGGGGGLRWRPGLLPMVSLAAPVAASSASAPCLLLLRPLPHCSSFSRSSGLRPGMPIVAGRRPGSCPSIAVVMASSIIWAALSLLFVDIPPRLGFVLGTPALWQLLRVVGGCLPQGLSQSGPRRRHLCLRLRRLGPPRPEWRRGPFPSPLSLAAGPGLAECLGHGGCEPRV